MNKKKRIVAIMTSICLLVIIGIKVPIWLSTPGIEAGEVVEEIPDPVEAEPAQEVLEIVENNDLSTPETVESEASDDTGLTDLLPESEDMQERAALEESAASYTTGEMGELLDGVSDIDEDWILQELDEHQDQIEQDDLEEGLAILDKIDANYLYEMSEDGFTEEEKAAAEAFLHAELSDEDVQAVWGLIHKYMELVD